MDLDYSYLKHPVAQAAVGFLRSWSFDSGSAGMIRTKGTWDAYHCHIPNSSGSVSAGWGPSLGLDDLALVLSV